MGDHGARHLATAGEAVHEGGCLPGDGDGDGDGNGDLYHDDPHEGHDDPHEGHDDEGGCLPGGGDGGGNDVEMVCMVIIMLIMMIMEDSVYQVILPSFQVHTSSSRY